MASLLWYGEQAFWVSNAAKDLLYEVAVEVAKRSYPIARQRLEEDGRLIGYYGVSGMGFELEAFAEAFGGKEAWQRAILDHFEAVEELCGYPRCVELMAKLFRWVWYLLDGGRCNSDPGKHPSLEHMAERPNQDDSACVNANQFGPFRPLPYPTRRMRSTAPPSNRKCQEHFATIKSS